VYKGLAGAALLFDELDSGDEKDPNPAAFHLPSGDFDVPLIFLDPILDPNHQAFFDPFNFNGHIGDLFTVNGKVQPKFSVFRRKYRFRVLNIGPSRFYQVSFSNKMPFQQISTDGNLLPAPITVNNLLLSVAERADIIVDFSKFNKGDQLFLMNTLEQVDGRGPTGKQLNPGIPMMRFDVIGDPIEADLSQVPSNLRPLPKIDLSKVSARRRFEFNRGNGMWTINGQVYSGTDERVKIPQGSAEIWTLKNGGGGWSHPIHIHFEEFQILSRNGGPPLLQERGRKDVVRLGPGDEAQIFIQFRDFLGQYVMHCHNVVHEDHAMMIRFQIV
jgi:FtsP/CotA-like multicopper oxidase with cupredoxin domain